ncbi:Diaminopimelate epimerase-like protein [Hypoxylon rubiginosum]|uniref:Diaminopimelate epimerase-like protein n=1 Tax=Hypoxylon rubiginosum TaxID=110542 RepID=A0ACB9Z3P2_9PEZI|nr:Diaminopimelate epimerase-like protein [Hypoxylon rubiginosum]
MELQFATLDVFTSTRMQGNPLAVVSVPAALQDRLPQAAKQKIAREFNLSETVFLHEAAADGNRSERRVDIFTTEQEIPFAGHPTIGTAVLARYYLHPHVDTLVTKAGPIGLVPQDGRRIRAKIPHNVHLHANTLADVIIGSGSGTGEEDYPGLSPVPEIRAAELAAPVFSVVRGMTFVLVRLPSLGLLGRVTEAARLDFAGLPKPLLDEAWRDSFVCRYYYVDVDPDKEDGEGEEGREGARHIRTRMVELGFEDPATGSAASALASYLTLKEGRKGEGTNRFRLTQGVEMGRRSDISVDTTTRETSDGVELVDLWLGGTAVVVMKGSLTVDV